jgi:hypothetical protein
MEIRIAGKAVDVKLVSENAAEVRVAKPKLNTKPKMVRGLGPQYNTGLPKLDALLNQGLWVGLGVTDVADATAILKTKVLIHSWTKKFYLEDQKRVDLLKLANDGVIPTTRAQAKLKKNDPKYAEKAKIMARLKRAFDVWRDKHDRSTYKSQERKWPQREGFGGK